MARAIAAAFPDATTEDVVRVDDTAASVDWTAPDEIVLVWPDGNGTGWSDLERVVFARKRASTVVRVLNGRRRCFVYDAVQRRAFRRRRLLEKTLAGELAFALVFVTLTPWLWLFDLVRGRR